eukprot:scaffold3326_cov116-Isochrysis_galbana.AAC.8
MLFLVVASRVRCTLSRALLFAVCDFASFCLAAGSAVAVAVREGGSRRVGAHRVLCVEVRRAPSSSSAARFMLMLHALRTSWPPRNTVGHREKCVAARDL